MTRSCPKPTRAPSPRSGAAALFGAVMLFVLLGSSACETKVLARGEENSIIVAARPDLWTEIEDSVYTVMEPRIFTTRPEKTFRLTFADPTGDDWGFRRRFRQELVIGTADDPWVAQALEEAPEVPGGDGARILQVNDVWARSQVVTVLLLPQGGGAADVYPLLDDLHALLDGQYRAWARARMYLSGRDSALADTLRQEFGFSLLLPEVYRWTHTDSVFFFRNDSPSPADRIREIMVTWRTPMLESLDGSTLLAWRAELARERYPDPQVLDTSRVETGMGRMDGLSFREVRAVWKNPPDSTWPAAGPFILRGLNCPPQDRTYLLDAWLYDPAEDKYQYIIQLEALLETFRCGREEAP